MTADQKFLLGFLLLAAAPVSATSTICTFSPNDNASGYDLEFIGYGRIEVIQANLPRGPRSLPGGSFKVLEFNEQERRIDLSYRNPGDLGLLPSFELKGAGDHVVMNIGARQVVGSLNCEY
jgi:hypothetical protein